MILQNCKGQGVQVSRNLWDHHRWPERHFVHPSPRHLVRFIFKSLVTHCWSMHPPCLWRQKHCHQEHLPHKRSSGQGLLEVTLHAMKSGELPAAIKHGCMMDPRDCLRKAAYNKHPANSTGSMFQIDKESMQKKKKTILQYGVCLCVCKTPLFMWDQGNSRHFCWQLCTRCH